MVSAYEAKPLLKTYQGHIEIGLKGGTNKYRITVTDNGCGLPKEQRNRLLEPYMTTRDKGTGLGLAIVQKITEQHDGHIVLEDAPETKKNKSGARVRLIIPYKKKNRSKVKPTTISVTTQSLGSGNKNSDTDPRHEGENYGV